LSNYSAAEANQSGRGHREEISIATKRTTKGDIIKIDTTDVVIQGNNEGTMIFVKSAKTSKEEDTGVANKTIDSILHASMVSIGTDTISKA
jgi:nitrate reductase NapAB chaperone NapD